MPSSAVILTSSRGALLTLVAGSQIGSLQITAKLGEGGMGEVYRATDSKLKRDVAINVLPAAFVADADRLARFVGLAKAMGATLDVTVHWLADVRRRVDGARTP